jgi:hypothetical protein
VAATARSEPESLEVRLQRALAVEGRARGTVGFFEHHRWLLRSGARRVVARKTLVRAYRQLAHVTREVARLRQAIRERELRRLRAEPPREAICGVFRENCRDAVDVAWCESHLEPTAHNGQYLGLFQMGALARHRFGHGPSAWEQATAAHRYFVYAGRDWSPWSCKPWGAFS